MPSTPTRGRLLVKNVFWNLLGLGSPILVGLFTIPHLLAWLGTVRFGILTVIWMFISYTSLLDLGLGRVLTQQLSVKMAHAAEKECVNLVWTTVFLLTLLGLLLGILFYLLSPWLVYQFLHIPRTDAADCVHAFYILAFSLPFVMATNCARAVLESHQAFARVNAVRIVMGMFVFLGPLVALLLKDSLAYVTLFLMIGKIVNCALYFCACFRIMPSLLQKFNVVLKEILASLRLGAWLTVSNIIDPLLGYLDRFFIANASLAAVAYYVTPNEMVTKLWLIPSAITAVIFPELSRLLIIDPERARDLYERSVKYIFLILSPLVLILIYFAQDLLSLWLGAAFAEHSYKVLQWLSLGVLINAIAHVPYTLILAKGAMHVIGILGLLELPLYAGALWLATRYGGIEIVAMVWVARMVLNTSVIFMLAHRRLGWRFTGVKSIFNWVVGQ